MMQNVDPAKFAAAEAALTYVRPGMKLGLGTGSTAALFVEALGRRVAQGLEIVGVPTSEATRMQAARLHIPLATLDQLPELDLTIDGADEFDGRLRLIKGAGGALLREKIVASASAKMVVIADRGKAVAQLGKFPLSVEVNPFGLATTTGQVQRAAAAVGCEGLIRLRRTPGQTAFVTDGGHYILDCSFGAIHDPEALSLALHAVPGVVEHGLFIGLASAVIIGDTDGVEIIGWRG